MLSKVSMSSRHPELNHIVALTLPKIRMLEDLEIPQQATGTVKKVLQEFLISPIVAHSARITDGMKNCENFVIDADVV